MNQPKFKVGDALWSKPWKCKFVVDSIRISAYGIHYCEETSDYVAEAECEPYVEPKPKKLYAYAGGSSGIVTFSTWPDRTEYDGLKRAPEFDIEYPAEVAGK